VPTMPPNRANTVNGACGPQNCTAAQIPCVLPIARVSGARDRQPVDLVTLACPACGRAVSVPRGSTARCTACHRDMKPMR
jgi:hypothetical protein